ncbi:MAG: Hsp20/alpha crystallin family protein [Candidatus Omnitrophica bacterium]|nr:Hsp20/alpha crystallin family protein [Candidatus Omnitrophota bacterium]
MELTKRDLWDPFDTLLDIQDDINRVFGRSLVRKNDWMAKGFNPDIEVTEEADHYVLHADLPGLKNEDFNISVYGNTLTLKGERKQEKESKEKGAYYSERYYGSFTRTMDFPTEIQGDKVKAAYKNGVLEVLLPKSESAKPKQINVEVK